MAEDNVHNLPYSDGNVFKLADRWEKHQPKEDDRGGGDGGGVPPDGGGGELVGPPPTWASHDAMALELAGRIDGSWHFVAKWKSWLYWDGQRWQKDIGLRIRRHVREVCRWVAARCDVKSLARSVTSDSAVRGVESLARCDVRLMRDAEEFDADLLLLNTPGGIIDLRTGDLFAHDKNQFMTEMAGAAPEGDCPVWMRFLSEFTGGDQDYQDYLQRLVGYSLTGSTEEEIFAFLHGPSNTGKSKFVETVRALHGTYGWNASMSTFIATDNHQHEAEIAVFVGKRLVTAAETDEGCRWDQQRMTTLTGRDEVTASFKNQNPFTYYPRFLLMFHGNHRPRLSADGGAMRRRLHLLPCRHRPAKPDRRLSYKLKAELGGIMRWAVLGAVLWKQHGLMPPPIVTDATAEYFATEDQLGGWMDEHCVQARNLTSLTRDLYNNYRDWAKATNEYVLSEKRFTNALLNLGFAPWRQPLTKRHGFIGLALRGSNDALPV